MKFDCLNKAVAQLQTLKILGFYCLIAPEENYLKNKLWIILITYLVSFGREIKSEKQSIR